MDRPPPAIAALVSASACSSGSLSARPRSTQRRCVCSFRDLLALRLVRLTDDVSRLHCQSLHIIMHTSEGATTQNGMSVVVQPMRVDVPEKEMPTASFKVHVESFVKGKPVEGELPNMSADDSCAYP
jgi:hypothetical protein